MKCPNCEIDLKPWPWYDGGYRGVECMSCEKQWASDEFESKACDAQKQAIDFLISSMDFPKDAEEKQLR